MHKTFCCIIHKNSSIFLKTWQFFPHGSTKKNRWGNWNQPEPVPRETFLSPPNMHSRTIILFGITKELNPTHASLLSLLPLEIFEDLYMWLSGLKHCDKFKHVILRFKYIINSALFTTSHDLWNLYHNIKTFCWYNKFHYDW